MIYSTYRRLEIRVGDDELEKLGQRTKVDSIFLRRYSQQLNDGQRCEVELQR